LIGGQGQNRTADTGIFSPEVLKFIAVDEYLQIQLIIDKTAI